MERRNPLTNNSEVALASERTSATLLWEQIRVDGGTQMRAGIHHDIVTEYADSMRANGQYAPFPPVLVFFDGNEYWLGDGFHRHAAYKEAFGSEFTIPVEIRAGTRRDAVLYAAGANANHGLRRTTGDKERAVDTLLSDEEWVQWSDREIARRCNVSHPFVAERRRQMTQATSQPASEPVVTGNVTSQPEPGSTDVTGNVTSQPDQERPSQERRYTTRHGTVATMKTGNIGSQSKPAEVGTVCTQTDTNTMRRNNEIVHQIDEYRKILVMMAETGRITGQYVTVDLVIQCIRDLIEALSNNLVAMDL